MMLRTAAVILLCLLMSQVNALIITDAKCLPGYDWVSSGAHFSMLVPTILSSDVQFQISKSLRCRSRAWSSLCPQRTCVGLRVLSMITSFELTSKYLEYNLEPLAEGYIYSGPTVANTNACRCSSVYYSLLSACAYCQGQKYLP